MNLKHYHVFRGEFNLNIVGWRNLLGRPNQFNDWLAVYYEYNGFWQQKSWPITTIPGVPWLLNPINKNGTAILQPGQYFKAYELGSYKGYSALKQVGPLRVYRDNNRDSEIDQDPVTVEEGLFGIHIHKAGVWTKLVGASSAGCQVFQKSADFDEFINLCETATINWGNKFSYTLIGI